MTTNIRTASNCQFRTAFFGLLLAIAMASVSQAQTVATWTGSGDGVSYSDATNWDTGVVPINAGGSTFEVVIPSGAAVTFDVVGTGNVVSELDLAVDATLAIEFGRDLGVTNLATIAGVVSANNSSFSGAPLTNADNSRLSVADGGTIGLGSTSYAHSRNASETIFSATGVSSVLNLSSLQSMNYSTVGALRGKTITANNGGTIDLSGLQSIDINPGEDDRLTIQIQSGGTVDLSSLATINQSVGNGNNFTRFELEATGNLDLSNLQTANDTDFVLANSVTLDLPQLTRAAGGSIELANGATLNATSLVDITDTQLSVVPGANLNAGPFSQIDNARISVEGGVTFDQVTTTSYAHSRNASETIFSASGVSSVLNLSSLQSMNYSTGGALRGKTITANNGGTIDLSGLQSIDINPGEDDRLTIQIQSGATVDLSALTSINQSVGNGNNFTRFELGATGNLDLGNLQTTNDTDFALANSVTLDLPQLTRAAGGSIELANGATLNATSLVDITDTVLSIVPGANLNAGPFSQIDNARFSVEGGATFDQVTTTSYAHSRNASETIFSATGVSSVLNLSSLQSMNYSTVGALRGKTITANNGGTIDLSGLQSIDVNPGEDDRLTIQIQSSGTVDLSALTSINQSIGNGNNFTRFELEATGNLDLSNLQTANDTDFVLANSVTFDLPQLTRANGGIIDLANGATLNATSLVDITDTELSIVPGANLNAGPFSQIDNARFSVEGGVTFDQVTDTSYAHSRNASETIFSATGVSSVLNLSSLQSMNYSTFGARREKTITANDGGTVDFSGLQSIDVNPGEDDGLTIQIQSGGTVDLSSLTSINQSIGNGNNFTRFEVSGNSTLQLGGLQTTSRVQIELQDLDSTISVAGDFRLDPTSSLTVAQGALLTVDGDFVLEQTDESLVNLDSAIVQIRGDRQGTYRLEVGGENLGLNQFSSGNFGMGQLILGGDNNDVFVSLLDVVDNGNGPGGEAESLYLYGLGGPDGLRVLDGSILALNGIDVYAWDDAAGEQIHLNSLFSGGQNIIPFDDGFLQLTGDPIAGDFDLDGDVDADDIDFYSGNIGQPASFDPRLDLDSDGQITLADHKRHVNGFVQTTDAIGTLIGDVNLDGSVDVLNDAAVLINSLGSAGPFGYAAGDLNADGQVDVLGDAARLVNNLGKSTASSARASGTVTTSAVPEPGSATLLTMAFLTGMLQSRRRRA